MKLRRRRRRHRLGLLSITTRLEVKKIIAEGNDAAMFFELETTAPVEATVLVAEWHHLSNGRIVHVESAFDGRPYAAMFEGSGRLEKLAAYLNGDIDRLRTRGARHA